MSGDADHGRLRRDAGHLPHGRLGAGVEYHELVDDGVEPRNRGLAVGVEAVDDCRVGLDLDDAGV